jgi:hypothetical protein
VIEHAGVDATRSVLTDALGEFVHADRSVRLDNVMRVVIARA